jgi:hypothetical protein
MIDLFKFKRAPSVLGLAFDGNRLEAVVLRRSNGTLLVRQRVSAPLALSPLTDDPELAGREIRNCLDAAGIRERRCAVCLPLSWLLTLQTKLPELPEADRAGFLRLEAERGFHSGPEAMFTAQSLFQPALGEQYATLLAVPRENLSTLERVLRAARLKPVTFGLGIAAVQPAAAESQRVITLLVRGSGIDLQVVGGGGIVALRCLDSAIETHGAVKQVSSEFVAREVRITLGQLPGGLAGGPGKIRIVGQGEMTRQFVHEISPRLTAMGLKVETSEHAFSGPLDNPLPADLAASPVVALAASWVGGRDTTPEFLPPKVRPWQQLLSKGMSTRKLIWAGEAAAGVVACIIVAFGVQQAMLSHLRGKWAVLEPKVTQLTAMQDEIQEFRDFYDQASRDARLWHALALILPRDNSVSLKSIEVRDLGNVICSGVAQDNDAFAKVYSKLSDDTNEISNVHIDDKRGQKPMQFTVNFTWGTGGGANGN